MNRSKNFLTVKKVLVLGGATYLFLSLGLLARSFAAEDKPAPREHGGCNYTDNQICTEYFACDKEMSGDFTNQTAMADGANKVNACRDKYKADHRASFCNYIKANDTVCDSTWPIAAGYSAAAVVCGVGCLVPAYGSWAIPICNALTPVVQAADFFVAIGVNTANSEYIEKADSHVVKDFWGSTGTGRDFLSYAAPHIAAAIQGATITGGYVGGAAAAKAGEEVGKTAAETAGKEGGEKGAEHGAKNAAACVSMVLNGLMAGVKWANFALVQTNSEENYNKMCSMHVSNCDFSKKEEAPGAPVAPIASMGGGGTPPTVADNRDRSPYLPVKIKDKVNKNPNKVSDSFANAELKDLFGTPPGAMKNALDEMYKQTGATPGDLAESVANNGLAGTLAKFGATKDGDLLKKIDALGPQYFKSNPIAFESTGGGVGRSGPAAASPFGGLFGNRSPAADAGKVNDMKFGGFNGDIWHAGTTLSIFEIVRQRTQSVSDRVGQP